MGAAAAKGCEWYQPTKINFSFSIALDISDSTLEAFSLSFFVFRQGNACVICKSTKNPLQFFKKYIFIVITVTVVVPVTC